jgi:Family of unknown function (DUF6064)
MSAWTPFRLSDLLLFSPRVFYRLFELINTEAWPAHVVMFAIGFAMVYWLTAPTTTRLRIGSVLLAGIWAWLAWFYLASHYATINWAAVWLIPVFAAEAALLLVAGTINLHRACSGLSSTQTRAIAALLALVLLAYPLLPLLAGRPLQQAEVFGIAPDPTAIATMLWLAAARGGFRWLLMIVPALWCAVSGLTLWLLDDPAFWLPPTAAALALALARTGRQGSV